MKPFVISLLLAAFVSSAPLSLADSTLDELHAKAERGDVHAQAMLASDMAYDVLLCPGVAKDLAENINWYRKVAEQGEPGSQWAQWELGMAYFRGAGVAQDNAEAVKWYRKAAEQGYAKAQYWLGRMIEAGDGVARDPAEAIKWYRKAGDQGDANAQYDLGYKFAHGDGVAKDPAESLKWYRMAAEQGYTPAQDWLGDMYSKGDGVAKDPVEAGKWYGKAAEHADMVTQFDLGYKFATGDGVAKDPSEARKWYRTSAERGYVLAQYYLGLSYFDLRRGAKDQIEAAKWFRKAAERGYAPAQASLGGMYDIGIGVANDPTEAVKWYRKAADQGDYSGQYNLGKMYAYGQGVPKDEIEALAWWNIAAASGTYKNDGIFAKERDSLELALGRQMSVVAQQRSKEILKEIEAAKARPPGFTAVDTSTLKSSGSGAIISAQGILLTAAHVVKDATRLTVLTAKGTCEAKLLRIDEANDLAILKIDGQAFVPLPVAPSRQVRLGQSVSTIGFPNTSFQGFSPKVTRGEISSVNGYADDPRSWQISAPVQPGNSGGPLLDENGNLIGVVVSKLGLKAAQATGDIPQNVNYAVKSAYALALLEPYLDKNALEPIQVTKSFEDMVAQAQRSVVLILAY